MGSLKDRFFDSSLVIVAFLVLSPHVHAQSTASIEGLVTDQHGALIAGAEITATDPAIAVARVAVTDGSGRHQLAALPVGDYRLEVGARGFQTRVLERVQSIQVMNEAPALHKYSGRMNKCHESCSIF